MFMDFSIEARVEEVIQPQRCGRVYWRGSWWKAACTLSITLEEGTICYVVDRRGITLLVEPT